MDKNGLAHWAFALLFTQVIEVPIYMRGLRVGPLKAFGASALTHPVVWFVIPAVWAALYRFAAGADARFALSPAAQFWGYGVLAEGFAVAAEAAYFHALGAKKTLRWALLANAVSALIGLASSRLTGWP